MFASRRRIALSGRTVSRAAATGLALAGVTPGVAHAAAAAVPPEAMLAGGAVLAAAGAAAAAWMGRRLRREFVRRTEAESRATDTRGRLEAITSAMREAVVAYDLDLRLQFVNPAFTTLTGYSLDEIRERNFVDYIHPDDRAAVLGEWDRLARGEALAGQEYRIVTRSGEIRWVSSSWQPMRDDEGRHIGYLGTEFDISERKAAEDEMRRDAELFQAVVEVQQAVSSAGLESETVMRVIAERSQLLTAAAGAAIETLRGGELVAQLAVGAAASHLMAAGSLSGQSVRTGEVLRCDDVATDPRVDRSVYEPLGIRSILVVPLKDDHRPVGVLKVVSDRPAAFSDSDARALRLLAGLMGTALSHAAAYEARQARLEARTRALQESEQRFKQLVDVAQEGIWVVDDRGVVTYVNQRLADLVGYAPGEMLGRPVFDLLDATGRAAAQQALARQGTVSHHHDLRFRHKDGTDIWGVVSMSPIMGRDGALVGSVGVVTDITQRKRAEEQLRRSAERLAMLHDIDQAVLAARSPAEIGRAALARIRRMVPSERCTVVLFDFDGGRAQVIAGYTGPLPMAPTVMPLESLSSADALRRGTVRYLEDLAAIDEPPPILQRLLGDGIRSVLSAPLLAEGEVIGELNLAAAAPAAFTAEHRDIALEAAAPIAIAIQQARLRDGLGRQAAELERRVADRSAALAAANADIETLLHSVSHDLRAPIRHVGSFAQLLLDEYGPRLDAPARHYAERIRAGARRLALLVDDLIQLSRVSRQELMLRPIELSELVEDAQVQLVSQAGHRVVRWEVGPLPRAVCDPTLVRTAVWHLLDNALKFTRSRPQAMIEVRAIEQDDLVGLAVRDNGVGFDPAQAGRIFEPFHRLHRADEFEGNGAGLAIVQRIARKHGGRAWAEAEAGCGATFYALIGRAPSPAETRHAVVHD